MPRRVCALVVLLALLVGVTLGASPGARPCGQCPPGCPMHARKLGCHQVGSFSRHRSAPKAGLRSACPHEPTATPARGVRGVLPEHLVAVPASASEPLSLARFIGRLGPFPEPPTHPPKALVG